MKLSTTVLACVVAVSPVTAFGQSAPPNLAGSWRAETPDGPQTIIVRPDSSASFGEEIVRWRLVADSIFIAFGDEAPADDFFTEAVVVEKKEEEKAAPAMPGGMGGMY